MTIQLDAPSTTLAAALDVPADGEPRLSVERDGRTVLAPSPLGIETLEHRYVEPLSTVDVERESVERQYETPAGKRRDHEYRASGAAVTLENADGARLVVDVRVSDTAVAYRYRLPGEGPVVVTGEESAFALPADGPAWSMPLEAKHEGVFRGTTAADADGDLGFPVLVELGEDWVFLTETDVDGRYCASHLTTREGSTEFAIQFPESPQYRYGTARQEISARRPLATPWRVAVVGSLGDVVRSDAVTDLVGERDDGPAVDPGAEWVEPGRVAWSWWSDGESPGDPDRQREYVDYAAERGWEYVLVDEGWEADWLPALVEYADDSGVGVFVWSRWSDLNTPEKRAHRLGRLADWGVTGVKVDFMNADTQAMLRFYDDLAAATAEHGLLLNVHGSITPRGLRRRWPHLLTYEGVHGAENYHPVPNTIPPEHNVILPYTRNVLGPMDYTPVVFSAETRQTSAGHELAQAVVYESGLQHFADSVESYAARPAAESFLEHVPAVWDETRFVGGRPGDRASLARRRGEEWYLGTITAGESRTVECQLSFLDGATGYEGELIREGDDGETLLRETIAVTADDVLWTDVAENGGFACRFTPAGE